jgi:hypothetical protein
LQLELRPSNCSFQRRKLTHAKRNLLIMDKGEKKEEKINKQNNYPI